VRVATSEHIPIKPYNNNYYFSYIEGVQGHTSAAIALSISTIWRLALRSGAKGRKYNAELLFSCTLVKSKQSTTDARQNPNSKRGEGYLTFFPADVKFGEHS